MDRSASSVPPTFNLRNNIRFGDKSDTPLQFVYEAADCRLWYTKDMLTDITAVWQKVADVAWGGMKGLCVAGSTGQPTSVSGGGANSTAFGNGTVASVLPQIRGRE
jgi:hypothetical protein